MAISELPELPELVAPIISSVPHSQHHWFIYADPGKMKSTFAATFPKPMLVLAFDPWGKMEPYRRRGIPGPMIDDNLVTPMEFVMRASEPDNAIIQIEQYFDSSYEKKQSFAWERLQARLPTLHTEVQMGVWQTIVLDSVSTLEYAIRKWQEKVANPTSKEGNKQDARQWYNSSGAGVQEVCYNLGFLRNVNVVVLAHIRLTRDRVRESNHWSPEIPGVYNRRVPGLFSEIYTIHQQTTPEEESIYTLQTTYDNEYIATTQIPAPTGISPHYENLWGTVSISEKD